MLTSSVLALAAAALPVSHAAHHGNARHARRIAHSNQPMGKRFSGARLTYYDTSVGLGACGIWHGNDEYTVALNSADLAGWGSGYPSPACGKSITIQVGDKQTSATIQDECPTCPEGGLDLSEGLFSFFADQSVGVLTANWWYSSDGAAATTTSTSQTPAWTPETTSTSSTEQAQPTTTWAAPTTTQAAPATSEAASTSADPSTTVQANAVIEEAASTTSIESEAPVAETTSSWAAPAETTSSWVAPAAETTSSWVAPAPTTTEAAWTAPAETPAETEWAAPSSTEEAWPAPSEAPAALALNLNGSACAAPGSFILFNETSVLYNGTFGVWNASALFNASASVPNSPPHGSHHGHSDVGGANATSLFSLFNVDGANATDAAVNGSQVLASLTGYCFNSTIYSVADVAANLTASIANFSSILISMSSFDANKTMDLFPKAGRF